MTLDDRELLWGQILLEFRDISGVSEAITAKHTRRASTRYGASNKCGVGKTSNFRAKCVNITRQMALTAAALLQTSRQLVCNLFSRRIGAIFGMLSRRAGLSASAGLS